MLGELRVDNLNVRGVEVEPIADQIDGMYYQGQVDLPNDDSAFIDSVRRAHEVVKVHPGWFPLRLQLYLP